MSGTHQAADYWDPTNTFGAGDLDFVYQIIEQRWLNRFNRTFHGSDSQKDGRALAGFWALNEDSSLGT